MVTADYFRLTFGYKTQFSNFRSLQYFMSKEKRNAKANIIKKKKKNITKKKTSL